MRESFKAGESVVGPRYISSSHISTSSCSDMAPLVANHLTKNLQSVNGVVTMPASTLLDIIAQAYNLGWSSADERINQRLNGNYTERTILASKAESLAMESDFISAFYREDNK